MSRSWRSTGVRTRLVLLALAIAIILPLAWVAWYLGSPLFIDRTVDESFPVGVAYRLLL